MRTGTECKQQQNNSPDQVLSGNTRLLSDLTSAGSCIQTNLMISKQTSWNRVATLLNLELTTSLFTLQKLAAARNQQAYIDFQEAILA